MKRHNKLKERIDDIVIRFGVHGGFGATALASRIIVTTKIKNGHEWEDKGIDPGGLGQRFGDHLLVCKKCGLEIIYSAIDHNIFEAWNKEKCLGEK